MSLYLEISPRQAGKTQRLLENVKKHLVAENPCVIFTLNHDISKTLKKILLKMDITEQFFNEKFIQILSHNMVDGLNSYDFSKHRTFFDEFDFYNSKFWRRIPSTRLDYDKAYYCTSPKRIRTLKEMVDKNSRDELVRLLQFTNFEYVSYPSLMNKGGLRTMLSEEKYLTEAEGIFVK